MNETTVHGGLRAGMDAVRNLGLDPRLDEACERAIASDALGGQTLRALAPDATAWSALVGGLHVVAAHLDPGQFVAALRYAAQAREGAAVAAVAGALLGAAHGMVALPVDLVSRHELSWALDTLARDLVTQRTDSPGGSEYTPARDDTWTTRYPGYRRRSHPSAGEQSTATKAAKAAEAAKPAAEHGCDPARDGRGAGRGHAGSRAACTASSRS